MQPHHHNKLLDAPELELARIQMLTKHLITALKRVDTHRPLQALLGELQDQCFDTIVAKTAVHHAEHEDTTAEVRP